MSNRRDLELRPIDIWVGVQIPSGRVDYKLRMLDEPDEFGHPVADCIKEVVYREIDRRPMNLRVPEGRWALETIRRLNTRHSEAIKEAFRAALEMKTGF